MKKLTQLILITLIAGLFSACGKSAQQHDSGSAMIGNEAPIVETADGPQEVDGQTAQRMVELEATLVDVRTPEEFAEEHIPGAINIPLAEISADELAEHGVSGPVILYCESGNRSGQAVQKLRDDGYEQSLSMGSIDEWPGETTSSDDSSGLRGTSFAQVDETSPVEDESPVEVEEVDPIESDEEPVGIDEDNNSLDDNGDDSIEIDDDNDSLGEPDDI